MASFLKNSFERYAFQILDVFKKFYYKKYLFNQLSKRNIQVDPSAKFSMSTTFMIDNSIKEFIVMSNFFCRENCKFLVYPGASLKINESVFLNNGCSINCLNNIEIGANTIFGEGVKIYDHNHLFHFNNENTLAVERNEFSTARIKIGDN